MPYARSRSGIKIFGDAYTWWNTAEGQYARGNLPLVGSVLVLSKTKRLRRGHVGVVTAIASEREIRLDHANWQPDAIITNMAVMDVSPANDWTQLRFWNKDARMWGAVYPASGFVYNLADKGKPSGTATTIISSGATLPTGRRSSPRPDIQRIASLQAIARGCGTTSRVRPAPCCNRTPSRCARAARR